MKRLILALSTGLGLGYSPIMPGTAGTLLAIPLIYFWPSNLYLVITLILVGTWSAQQAEKYLGHDNPKIVIDEIAGLVIALYGINFLWVIPAFLIFRFLDIVKPQPINSLQNFPGGWGVMADDLAAGLVTNIILRLIMQLI